MAPGGLFSLRPEYGYFAIYGRIILHKAFCQQCQGFAFVLTSQMACCGVRASDTAEGFRMECDSHRQRWKPGVRFGKKQLERQDHRCFYCRVPLIGYAFRDGRAIKLKLHWDHRVPFLYLQSNPHENFVAACHICNMIKGSKLFNTIKRRRVIISAPEEKPKGICKVCGKPFVQSRPWRKYCSSTCRWIAFKESRSGIAS